MRKVYLWIGLFSVLFLSNCVTLQQKEPVTVYLENARVVSIIIPNVKEIYADNYTHVMFNNAVWGRSYFHGEISKQQLIRIRNKTSDSFEVDRRVDNGLSGSGIVYSVDYSLKDDGENTILEIKPAKSRTYQEGLISFPVPYFSEDNLISYIVSHHVGYSIEINSQFNTESIFANFERLATKEPYEQGEKDPVTGKIFKNRYSIKYKETKVLFSLETFPYRNGSKAVIYVSIPGRYTSENTIDFNIIINEIKTQLESIVNS